MTQIQLNTDPVITRSLNRSTLRKRILKHLNINSPRYMYLSEIARGVWSDPSNVLGCLTGIEGRYKESTSLVTLELVETQEINGNTYYKITPKGKQIAKHLKKQEQKQRS